MDGGVGFHFRSIFCSPFKSILKVCFGSGLIASACFGLLGSVSQLLLWKSYLKRYDVRHKPSSNPHIVFNLALCNALSCLTSATFGLTLLFSHKSYGNGMISRNISLRDIDGMVAITVLYNFGYIASALWTLMYFVDVCAQVHKINCRLIFQYLPCWGLAIIFTVLIEIFKFTKSDSLRDCISSRYVVANTIVWVSTIAIVMFLLVAFLYAIDRRVKENIGLVSTIYTNSERSLMKRVRRKFVLFLVIFLICWLPTLIIGILQLASYSFRAQEVLSFAEALFHPLQGILNYFIFTPLRPGQSLLTYGGDRNSLTPSLRIKQQYFDTSYESSVSANMAHVPILQQSVSSFHFTPCLLDPDASSVRTYHSNDTLDAVGSNYSHSLESSLAIGRLLGENSALDL